MYRIKYCKVDTASTDSPFPKRCRAKLPPHEETKSIEWHSTLALCMKSEEQPIPGVAHQPPHPWRVVQTGKASLRKSLCLHPHARVAHRQTPITRKALTKQRSGLFRICASRKSNSATNLQGCTSHGINTSMMKRTQPRLPWRVVRLDVAAQLKIPALPRLPFRMKPP